MPFLWPLLAVWGRSWGEHWRSLVALGAHVGGLVRFLGPMLAVLGPLGAYCDGPGPPLEPLLAVLGTLGTYVRNPGPPLKRMFGGPGPSWDPCWRSSAVLGEMLPKP